MSRYRGAYPPEFRRRTADLVRSGRTPEDVARESVPTAQSTLNWVKQAERDAGRRSDGAPSAEREELARLRRELAANVRERLQDALLACGIAAIDQDAPFDRSLHQAVRPTSGVAPRDTGWTASIVSPVFRLDRRVLRRARADVQRATCTSEPNDGRQNLA